MRHLVYSHIRWKRRELVCSLVILCITDTHNALSQSSSSQCMSTRETSREPKAALWDVFGSYVMCHQAWKALDKQSSNCPYGQSLHCMGMMRQAVRMAAFRCVPQHSRERQTSMQFKACTPGCYEGCLLSTRKTWMTRCAVTSGSSGLRLLGGAAAAACAVAQLLEGLNKNPLQALLELLQALALLLGFLARRAGRR